MSTLSLAELKKRVGRIETFVSKLESGSPFEIQGPKNFKANSIRVYEKSTLKNVFTPKNKNDNDFKSALLYFHKNAKSTDKIFISDGKEEISLGKIIKNHEFGGKGAGGSLKVESAAIKQTTEAIEDAIKKAKGPIKIKCDNKIYDDIVAVEKTEGTPKSDFHLINSKNIAVIWVSHKDGSTAKHMQQWGGISQRVEPEIFSHKETQKFIEDLKKTYPQGLPPATTVFRYIKDNRLKMLSVYGNQFGSKLGEQNVTVLLRGPVSLTQQGNHFAFSANHVHYNGDSVDSNGYEPVLMAIYRGDRSDVGVKGTRIVISPVGGRKGIEFKSL